MEFTITPGAMPSGYAEGILSEADARAHLRLTGDEGADQLDMVGPLRDAAVDFVEQYCSLWLRPRTGAVATFAGFGPNMRTGWGPNLTVTGISYDDSTGASVSLDAGGWRVGPGGRIIPGIGKSWPGDCYGDVRVTFSAGYAAGTVPAGLVVAVRRMLATFYDIRSDVVSNAMSAEVPMGVRMLCDQHRMPVIG